MNKQKNSTLKELESSDLQSDLKKKQDGLFCPFCGSTHSGLCEKVRGKAYDPDSETMDWTVIDDYINDIKHKVRQAGLREAVEIILDKEKNWNHSMVATEALSQSRKNIEERMEGN